MSGYIYDNSLVYVSFARACKLAPTEYVPAYQWFIEHEGAHIDRLPYGPGKPHEFEYPLARQAGIFHLGQHWLSQESKGKKLYALSVHSEGTIRYDDNEVLHRPDGTWIFDYCAQAPKQGKQTVTYYNEALMNCLDDGLPVGVMVKHPKGGYDVLGLAYVEKFNALTQMFTFHGPVNAQTDASGAFAFPDAAELKPAGMDELKRMEKVLGKATPGTEDERAIAFVAQVRREGQQRFRRLVEEAYGGACAISGVSVPQALQAAHIDPYRGKKSQIVTNGILLRSDIHLLYDANLLAITPDYHHIELSHALQGTGYEDYAEGKVLRLPKDHKLWPDDELLERHYQEFKALELSA